MLRVKGIDIYIFYVVVILWCNIIKYNRWYIGMSSVVSYIKYNFFII